MAKANDEWTGSAVKVPVKGCTAVVIMTSQDSGTEPEWYSTTYGHGANFSYMAQSPTTAGPALGTPYGVLLARLGQDATARFRRALRPLGLTAQQFIVLKQLETTGTTSQTALADALGVDYSNM